MRRKLVVSLGTVSCLLDEIQQGQGKEGLFVQATDGNLLPVDVRPVRHAKLDFN